MSRLRRNLAISSVDRYFAIIARFATLMITARLLTPAEFGVAVIGFTILGIANIIRDFGGSAYIVQVDEIGPQRMQTVFTVTLFLTLPLSILAVALARPLADFYGAPGLDNYLWVTAICFMFGPFIAPIGALMRRELAFGTIATVGVVSTIVNAAVTIVLAMLGFSFMSFAWASLASGTLSLMLYLYWHPPYKVYRLCLVDWRRVAEYGVFESARNVLLYLWDSLPLLILGRTVGTGSLGAYQRAITLAGQPFTTLLAGLSPVILPTLSGQAREGKSLGDSFVKGVSYITALLWPSLITIVLLAHPIVEILLGPLWHSAAPLTQIVAASYLFWFPSGMINPVLIAAGHVRDTFIVVLLTVPAAITIQALASLHSIHAVAWSNFVTVPIFISMSVYMVHRRVSFQWSALRLALLRSGSVTLVTAVPALLAIVASGGFDQVSIPAALIAMICTAPCWLAGLRIANHPMLHELTHLRDIGVRRVSAATTRLAVIRQVIK